MAVALVIAARCRFCSQACDPREFAGNPATYPCWNCYQTHLKALALLQGSLLQGELRCKVCNVGQEELGARRAHGDIPGSRMFMHPKDGIYQELCGRCSDRYERQRLDLYGDTPYGAARKLKGAK